MRLRQRNSLVSQRKSWTHHWENIHHTVLFLKKKPNYTPSNNMWTSLLTLINGWYYAAGGKWHHSVGHDSDHELLIANFRLRLKKVGKITRPFRYDLNQIPYDYIVEVRNRFKGLDLIECLKNYGQRFVTLYGRQGLRPSPRKRSAKRENGCLWSSYK